MQIVKSKVIKIGKYKDFFNGKDFFISSTNENRNFQNLISTQRKGIYFIPPQIGNISNYNVKGKEIILKNEEKEYRTIHREGRDWHGNTHDMSYTKLCFKKEHKKALNQKFIIENNKILSEKINFSTFSDEYIIYYINLFLEYFGECEFLDGNKEKIIRTSRTVNWEVLPSGSNLDLLKEQVKNHYINNNKKQSIILERFEKIEALEPNFTASGINNFKGYYVFGFEEKSIYILESIKTDNAIYIFENEWEELSKKSKYELIQNYAKKMKRICHKGDWENKIKTLLI